jgi:hypothetical protein
MTIESDLRQVKGGQHLRFISHTQDPEVCMWGVLEHLEHIPGPCGCCVGSVDKSARPQMMVLLAKQIDSPPRFLKVWQNFPEYYKTDIDIVKAIASAYPQFVPLLQVYVDETLTVVAPPEVLKTVEKVDFEPDKDTLPPAIVLSSLKEKLEKELKTQEEKEQKRQEYRETRMEQDFLHLDQMKEQNGVWSRSYDGRTVCSFRVSFDNVPIGYEALLKLYGESRKCTASINCARTSGFDCFTLDCNIVPNTLDKEQEELIRLSMERTQIAKEKAKRSKQAYEELLENFKKEEEEEHKREKERKVQRERANINAVVDEYFRGWDRSDYWSFDPENKCLYYYGSVYAHSDENMEEAIRRIVDRLQKADYKYEVRGYCTVIAYISFSF